MATDENDSTVGSLLETPRIDTWNIERTDQELRRFIDQRSADFDVLSLDILTD